LDGTRRSKVVPAAHVPALPTPSDELGIREDDNKFASEEPILPEKLDNKTLGLQVSAFPSRVQVREQNSVKNMPGIDSLLLGIASSIFEPSGKRTSSKAESSGKGYCTVCIWNLLSKIFNFRNDWSVRTKHGWKCKSPFLNKRKRADIEKTI
jgi:hypothetical protein